MNGNIAWTVRKENQALLLSLNDFIQKNKKRTLLGNILFKRYYQNSKWITNPVAETERKKLNHLIGLFKKYGDRYDFHFYNFPPRPIRNPASTIQDEALQAPLASCRYCPGQLRTNT